MPTTTYIATCTTSSVWYELSAGQYSPAFRNFIDDRQERNFARLFAEHAAQNATYKANIEQATQAARAAIDAECHKTISQLTYNDANLASIRTMISQKYTTELYAQQKKIVALENRCEALETGIRFLALGTTIGFLLSKALY